MQRLGNRELESKSENQMVLYHQANMEDETSGTKLNWLYALWDESLSFVKKYGILYIDRNKGRITGCLKCGLKLQYFVTKLAVVKNATTLLMKITFKK